MTVYTKTMMEALAEVRDLKEDNIDLLRKAAGGAMQTLKMKDGKLKMDKVTASAIMQILDKVNPANQKKIEKMINDGNKSGIIKLSDFAMSKVTGFKSEETELDEGKEKSARQLIDPKKEVLVVKKNNVVVIDKVNQDYYLKKGWSLAEETELDEAPKYELYHKDFSSAMQHAYKMAKKLHGITVKPKEIDDKVASGPRKPSEGKTNSYRLEGDKGAIQVQVYNKGGSKPYELNFYKEEVELDEANYEIKNGKIHISKKDYAKKPKEYKGNRNGKPTLMALDPKTGSTTSFEVIFEEVELDEMSPKDTILKKTANHLQALIKGANFPDDNAAYSAARDYVEAGNLKTVADIVKKLDTEPKEAIINAVAKGMGKKEAEKIFKVRILRVEEVELDEGKMKELHGYIQDGKSAEWIAKKMGVDVKTIKALMSGYNEAYELGTNEYREYIEKLTPGEVDEASARADAMRAMRKGKEVDPADVDTDATDDDVKGASKNIIMQMRKAVSLRGNFPVEFGDGKKVKIPAKVGQAVQDKYNSLKKPADKEKFQAQVAKSYKDMLKVLKAGYMMKAAYEEVELDEAKIAFKTKAKDGGYFVVLHRDISGMKGKQDKFLMRHMKGGKVKDWGSHTSVDGAKKFAINRGIIDEETILERIDRKLKERKNG